MLKASPLCKVFLDDESGLELSEYSVAAALVILGIIVAIGALGNNIKTVIDNLASKIN
jgi:Flp pilus assembly pilin Flp